MQEEITGKELSAQLQALKFGESEKKCPSGKRITRLCTNPSCDQALQCGDAGCEQCSKSHLACPHVDLSSITNLLNGRIAEFQKLTAQALHMENIFISELRESRSKLIKSLQARCLDKDLMAVFKGIYESDEPGRGCSGQEAKSLVEALRTELEGTSRFSDVLLEDYKKKLASLFRELEEYQEKLLRLLQRFITSLSAPSVGLNSLVIK
jgi:hypothetical protein